MDLTQWKKLIRDMDKNQKNGYKDEYRVMTLSEIIYHRAASKTQNDNYIYFGIKHKTYHFHTKDAIKYVAGLDKKIQKLLKNYIEIKLTNGNALYITEDALKSIKVVENVSWKKIKYKYWLFDFALSNEDIELILQAKKA